MCVTGSLGVSSLTEFRTQEARWIFYLSQIFTDEQKPFCSQGEPTNACRQATDITEFTANVSCNALCFRLRARTFAASPPTPLRMERGVITEIPLHVLQMFSGPSPIISRPKGVTSHTTPLSIRRGAGGEASVTSVCRRRSVCSKRAPKGSVNSVRSVREKTPHASCKQPTRGNLAYYSPLCDAGVREESS